MIPPMCFCGTTVSLQAESQPTENKEKAAGQTTKQDILLDTASEVEVHLEFNKITFNNEL